MVIGLTITLVLIVQAAGSWRIRQTPTVRAGQPPPTGSVHGPMHISVRDLPPPTSASAGAAQRPRTLSRYSGGANSSAPVPAASVIARTAATAPIVSSLRFDGLDNGANTVMGIDVTPPDSQVAVGPDDVVEMVNIVGRVYDRNGHTIQTYALDNFFGVPAGHRSFDPRVAYDAQSGRWFATFASFLNRATGTDEGGLYFAVSAGSDPTGSWNVYSITYTNVFPDQPAFGLTGDKFTISSNIFDVDGPPGPVTAGCSLSTGYCGDQITVFQKGDLLAGVRGSSLQLHSFPYDSNSFTIRPAIGLGSINDQYLTTFSIFSSTVFRVLRITGTPANGNVAIAGDTSLTIQAHLDPPPSVTAGAGNCIVGTNNLGLPPCIDSGDGRPLTVIWRNNQLWTSATAACQPSSDTVVRACAHLIEVATQGPPSVTQDIMYGAASQYYSYPAVATDASDNVYVSLTHTSSSVFAEAVLAGRLSSDPLNTLSAAAVLRAGTVVHTSGRWGDYLDAAVDPAAPSCVWVVGEYAKSVPGQDWATYIAAASFDGSCANISTPTPSSPTSTRTPTMPAMPTSTDTPTSTPTATDTPTPTATSTPTTTPTPTPLFGDVNCDRAVNSIDATFVLQFSAGLLAELPCPQNGDVNRDGQTNALDATLILQFSAGLIHTLPT